MAKINTAAGNNGSSKQPTWSRKMTKRHAIQLAFFELGENAARKDIQNLIKEKVGFNINSGHIGAEKNKLRREGFFSGRSPQPKVEQPLPSKKPAVAKKPVGRKPVGRRPGRIAAINKAEQVPVASPELIGISLQDLLALRDLVRRIGAESLHILVNAFDPHRS